MSQPSGRKVDAAAQRAVARLSSVVRASGVYPLQHPAMSRSIEGVRQSLTELVELQGPTELRLHSEAILVGQRAVRTGASARQALDQLVPLFSGLEVGGVRVESAPTHDDCVALAEVLLLGNSEQGTTFRQACEHLQDRGVQSLGLSPLDAEQDRDWHEQELAPELASLTAYLDAIQAVHRLYRDGLDPGVVVRLTRAGQELVEAVTRWPSRAAVLVSPRQHLPYELRHPVHVAVLSALVGVRLGLDKGELLELILCSFAIDSGMATIPASIRNKAGALDSKERALVEAHPIESVKALLGSPSLSPSVRRRVRVAFESHLGYDASGYPDTLRWGKLHLYSRIVSLADAYDALRADTPYRKSMSQSAALSVLRQQAGKRYDPVLTEIVIETVQQLQKRLDREDPHAL